jgi:hypothetical protein
MDWKAELDRFYRERSDPGAQKLQELRVAQECAARVIFPALYDLCEHMVGKHGRRVVISPSLAQMGGETFTKGFTIIVEYADVEEYECGVEVRGNQVVLFLRDQDAVRVSSVSEACGDQITYLVVKAYIEQMQ